METTQRAYLPAAGHDIFLPLYDPLVKLLGGDKARRTLLDQAAIDAVQRWRYTPTLLNGVPVPVLITITVRFALR